VPARREFKRGYRRAADADAPQGRVVGPVGAPASGAVLPLADGCLLEGRDVLGARRDSYGIRLPETEGVHRSGRPRATGPAVAVSHGFGRAGDFESDRTAKAASSVRHR